MPKNRGHCYSEIWILNITHWKWDILGYLLCPAPGHRYNRYTSADPRTWVDEFRDQAGLFIVCLKSCRNSDENCLRKKKKNTRKSKVCKISVSQIVNTAAGPGHNILNSWTGLLYHADVLISGVVINYCDCGAVTRKGAPNQGQTPLLAATLYSGSTSVYPWRAFKSTLSIPDGKINVGRGEKLWCGLIPRG